ncbi:TfuA-like protein [Sorangium sp. So ce185]|uniref:TfuA-like protein n=1 Tax=Sorangium sp. So ce185 TaxID=3133287 RepID=UPI003F647DCF
MTVHLFLGPTLSAAEAAEVLDAVILPPVAHGDVYRAAQRGARVIGIVDGYFEGVPSVWHKEILWAMREGVHVFGSASMGALRAAELASFGMEGVGDVFEAYQRGELEDDDEVAVAHAPAAYGYRALSVAMVNIRATLAAAEARGVVRPATCAALLRIAKQLFYPDRSYPRLLSEAAAAGLDPGELSALKGFLPEGQVDRKRADALAMLRAIEARLAAGLAPKQVRYHFEATIFWDSLRQAAAPVDEPRDEGGEGSWMQSALLDEARLHPVAYALARKGALTRLLSQALSDEHAPRPLGEEVDAAILSFRRARGLWDADAMEGWLRENGLRAEEFARLMESEAQVAAVQRWAAPHISAHLVDQLRLDDLYVGLWARARDKQRSLEEAGLADPDLAAAPLSREALLSWYLERRGEGAAPRDLAEAARRAGFRDEPMFLRALLREYHYVRLRELRER